MPVNLVTDGGSQFAGSYSASTTTSTIAAYNPQANGLVERWHHVLQVTLKATANKLQYWADRLPILLLGLRARPSSDSGLSPHQMVFGTETYLPVDFISRDTQEMGGTEFYEKLQKARQGYVSPDYNPSTRRVCSLRGEIPRSWCFYRYATRALTKWSAEGLSHLSLK